MSEDPLGWPLEESGKIDNWRNVKKTFETEATCAKMGMEVKESYIRITRESVLLLEHKVQCGKR